jgi:hypothetical protein
VWPDVGLEINDIRSALDGAANVSADKAGDRLIPRQFRRAIQQRSDLLGEIRRQFRLGGSCAISSACLRDQLARELGFEPPPHLL